MTDKSETTVHTTAQAYQKVSNVYERGRPEYTTESVEALVKALNVGPKSKLLDLGAGTGKFTKLLLPHSPNLVAVEPVDSMREKLVGVLPASAVFPGSAEAIPFPAESLDFVFVANAFHWFDAPQALKEIQRVLNPGGGLGLIWLNDGVFTSEWGKIIDGMLKPFEGAAPQRKSGVWRRAFAESHFFTPLQEAELLHTRETTPELVLDRVASLSFIAVLPETESAALLGRVKELLATHELTRGQVTLRVECSTDIYWCFKN